jgi:hypothetical protein
MHCPHCGKEIEEQAPFDPANRKHLIGWLENWRRENGVGDSGRPLRNRSLAQLRTMYDQAQAGKSYRAGRRWTQG